MYDLNSMFFPKSVAIIGVSADGMGGGGTGFFSRLTRVGYTGKLYPINPKISEVQGYKVYPSVKALPEVPDLVIIGIPATGVPAALRDCIAAGVKNVHIFSSGFSETGEEKGRILDREITGIIQNSDLRVVGPNCMGIYVPASKLAGWGNVPKASGPLAFISQSGGHGQLITDYAQKLGVYFSKVISYGNARGLQAYDFLEYLRDDPETKIISCYFEGMKDGNRVARLIRQINHKKPVIVWKGGLTESGSRAIASHTGSLAGETKIWDAFYAQTGAIRADSLEEIIAAATLFLYSKPPRGRRVLVFAGGGGNSVALADTCSREGLVVPHISEATRKELNKMIRLEGNSVRNPLDIFGVHFDLNTFRRVLELVAVDPMVDILLINRTISDPDNGMYHSNVDVEKHINQFIIDFAKQNIDKIPLVVSLNIHSHSPSPAQSAARVWEEFAHAGVPVFPSTASAARALSRYISYHEYQAKEQVLS
jgi:acyl-CoA synthetase (NDP forming)